MSFIFFFFNDTATTEIYTLSLHDALPISLLDLSSSGSPRYHSQAPSNPEIALSVATRSEEHTSELQSHLNLVCRLLLEKKKTTSTSSSGRHSRSFTYTARTQNPHHTHSSS